MPRRFHLGENDPLETQPRLSVARRCGRRAHAMKPSAPPLSVPDEAPASSIESEIARVCETKAAAERPTIPAPPSPETLKAATPCPPAREENHLDTIPAPAPSSIRKREQGDEEPPVSTIPGAPPLPNIHSM